MRRALPSVWSSLCITNVVLNSERCSTTCAVSEEHLPTSPSTCVAPAPVPLPSAVSRTPPHKLGTPAHAGPPALKAPSSTTAGGSGSKGEGHGGGGGGTRRCTHCMAMGTTGGFRGGFEAQRVVLWAQEVVGHLLRVSCTCRAKLTPTQCFFCDSKNSEEGDTQRGVGRAPEGRLAAGAATMGTGTLCILAAALLCGRARVVGTESPFSVDARAGTQEYRSSTLAGVCESPATWPWHQDGAAGTAKFDGPTAAAAYGRSVLVADAGNLLIRRWQDGRIESGSQSSLSYMWA